MTRLPTCLAPASFVAGLSAILLLGGCQERLAQRDAYFAPMSGLSVSLHAETEHLVNYHRALQAARHGCHDRHSMAASPDEAGIGRTVPEASGGNDAHAQLCAPPGVTHAAQGAVLNGYRRWVGDAVRPLPSPSETASSIGSGS